MNCMLFRNRKGVYTQIDGRRYYPDRDLFPNAREGFADVQVVEDREDYGFISGKMLFKGVKTEWVVPVSDVGLVGNKEYVKKSILLGFHGGVRYVYIDYEISKSTGHEVEDYGEVYVNGEFCLKVDGVIPVALIQGSKEINTDKESILGFINTKSNNYVKDSDKEVFYMSLAGEYNLLRRDSNRTCAYAYDGLILFENGIDGYDVKFPDDDCIYSFNKANIKEILDDIDAVPEKAYTYDEVLDMCKKNYVAVGFTDNGKYVDKPVKEGTFKLLGEEKNLLMYNQSYDSVLTIRGCKHTDMFKKSVEGILSDFESAKKFKKDDTLSELVDFIKSVNAFTGWKLM